MDKARALADLDETIRLVSDETVKGSEAMTLMLTCVARHSPRGSIYQTEAAAARESGSWVQELVLLGVVQALRRDLSNDKLATFEELLHADVYSDLLNQGQGLQTDGYSRAAMVVAGAALEEHIRKLCVKNGIALEIPHSRDPTKLEPKKASVLNAELKKAGVYQEAKRAVVEGWQKLRNAAAHGEPGFDGPDRSHESSIKPVIDGIRAFIVHYPA
jgi:hypothetical protein